MCFARGIERDRNIKFLSEFECLNEICMMETRMGIKKQTRPRGFAWGADLTLKKK